MWTSVKSHSRLGIERLNSNFYIIFPSYHDCKRLNLLCHSHTIELALWQAEVHLWIEAMASKFVPAGRHQRLLFATSLVIPPYIRTV